MPLNRHADRRVTRAGKVFHGSGRSATTQYHGSRQLAGRVHRATTRIHLALGAAAPSDERISVSSV